CSSDLVALERNGTEVEVVTNLAAVEPVHQFLIDLGQRQCVAHGQLEFGNQVAAAVHPLALGEGGAHRVVPQGLADELMEGETAAVDITTGAAEHGTRADIELEAPLVRFTQHSGLRVANQNLG